MIQKSLLEQLGILYKTFSSNSKFLVITIISIIIFILLLIFNFLKNKKILKRILLVVYLGITITLMIFYHNEILTFLDYLVNNIFILLFFPNVAVYTLVIIIVNILMIRTILNRNYEKILKIINLLFFIIFNIIFYLIIDNVLKNKIDIYNELNVYTNGNLMVLIQVSMYLFILWMIILLISKVSKFILVPNALKRNVKVPSTYIPSIYSNEDTMIKKLKPKKIISDIPEITPNTIVVTNNFKDTLKYDKLEEKLNVTNTSNLYNRYIDVVPVKKKSVDISNLNSSIENEKKVLNNMDIVFGKANTLSSIMEDITKLREDKNNVDQIQKIYKQISLNSNDLTLNDYNYLIKALKEIKNNN
ncbi:MAG: hypothetical protein IKN63_06965 [Bacilli bacterium]|nr:hypothetical protein [Bacilli bacterium]